MPARNVVCGAKTSSAIRQASKDLRQNMTEAEALLWRRLRTNRLKGWHFRRQQVIDRFIVDFYCHAAGLVIEVDGEIHQQQFDYDNERDSVLKAMGFEILRFSNQDVLSNIDYVLDTILRALTPLPPSRRGKGVGG
jgi:very-short-patch-repair endonuclease